jgi:hypothetical protein
LIAACWNFSEYEESKKAELEKDEGKSSKIQISEE